MILSSAYVGRVLIIVSSLGSFLTAICLIGANIVANYRQQLAYKGDVEAGKKLILPCYRPLFYALAAFFVFLSFAQLLTLTHRYTIYAIYYILQYHSLCLLAVYLISPVLLTKHSISQKSFYSTFYTIFPWWVVTSIMWALGFFMPKTLLPTQIVFILLTFIPPLVLSAGILRRAIPSRVQLGSKSNRCSSEYLLVYTVLFGGLNLWHITRSRYYDGSSAFATSLLLVGVTFVWNLLYAISLHRSLLADTKFWRGIGTHNQQGIRSSRLDGNNSSIHKPTMDVSVASTHFQTMMANIGDIVIDFAFLEAKKCIGDGATSEVFSGLYKGQSVAIKVSTPTEINEEVIDVFAKEGVLSSNLQHKNIVKFYGLCVRPPQIAMVMELCENGNLKSSIAKYPEKWTPLMRLKACLGACRSLEYLHGMGYIHRDLKTENFFLSKDWDVKLGDFGESTKQQIPEEEGGVKRRMTILGTVSYMAPELIAAAKFYTKAIDIYALGITFWEVWTGKDCYDNRSQFDVYKCVSEGIRPEIDDIDAPNEFIDAMCAAWHQNPDRRPSATQLADIMTALVFQFGGTAADIQSGGTEKAADGPRNFPVLRGIGKMVKSMRLNFSESVTDEIRETEVSRPSEYVFRPFSMSISSPSRALSSDSGSPSKKLEFGASGGSSNDAPASASPSPRKPVDSDFDIESGKTESTNSSVNSVIETTVSPLGSVVEEADTKITQNPSEEAVDITSAAATTEKDVESQLTTEKSGPRGSVRLSTTNFANNGRTVSSQSDFSVVSSIQEDENL